MNNLAGDELRFLSLPNAKISEADCVILPAPLERTVTFKAGTSEAPRAILRATDQLEFYDELVGWSPMKHMKVTVTPEIRPKQKESLEKYHQRLTTTVSNLPDNNFLIALGGEHSITPSIVDGRMNGAGAVLLLDAHADLRPSYRGERLNHASPAYRLLSSGYNMTLAGVRSFFEAEAELIHSHDKITLFAAHHLRAENGWKEFISHIKSLTGPVWLSIDMDVFDPSIAPGVGTPQHGGIGWDHALEILRTLLFENSAVDIRGMDIVELTPEPSQVTQMLAAQIIHKAISLWGRQKGYDNKPAAGSQSLIDYE